MMRTSLRILFLAGVLWAGTVAAGVSPDALSTSDTCGECHRDIYRMWRESAHATAMENTAFLAAYREVESNRPLGGLCLRCHAPMARILGDSELQQKISWEGVTCDFCHSLVDVRVEKGVPGRRIEIGDVKRGPIRGAESPGHEVAYSEMFKKSIVCAPCHEYANDDGTPILTTYSEWKDSQAAKRGETCQTCHMGLVEANVVDPVVKRVVGAKVNLHAIPGGHSLQQLHKALGVAIEPTRLGDDLELDIVLTNNGAGHSVPTGMPGRRILMELVVETDEGQAFEEVRDYSASFETSAGKPIVHVADYFRRGVRATSDTRIGVDETRTESFRFTVPAASAIYVTVRLQYEYAPRGPGNESTRLTFLAERRFIRPAQ